MRIVHDPAVFDIADDVPGDRGRRVETQTELLAGDLALRASAHAVVLLPELWSSHCHKCFVGSDLRRLSRCGCCRTVYYCASMTQLIIHVELLIMLERFATAKIDAFMLYERFQKVSATRLALGSSEGVQESLAVGPARTDE